MTYDERKQQIDNWVRQYENHCAELGTISFSWQIAKFLDQVVLKLWTNKFNPLDVEYLNESEAEQCVIDSIMEEFKFIVDMFPIEILYYYGYAQARSNCFLIEEIFDKTIDYGFCNSMERYIGAFSPKMTDILIEKLGVKRLFS